MANKKSTKTLRVQFIQYLIGGGAFFWSGYAAFAVFDALFSLPLFAAKQLANVVGLTVNYLLQDRWVFNDKARQKLQSRRTGRYAIIMLVNFGIDYLIVAGLKDKGISPYLGQFASAGFFTVWNFLWYKHWVFAVHVPQKSKGANK